MRPAGNQALPAAHRRNRYQAVGPAGLRGRLWPVTRERTSLVRTMEARPTFDMVIRPAWCAR